MTFLKKDDIILLRKWSRKISDAHAPERVSERWGMSVPPFPKRLVQSRRFSYAQKQEETMNKRIKKKRALENSLRIAGSAIEFLLDQNNQLWRIFEKMEGINSKNVKATNNRFDKVEEDIKSLKKTQKKSWFSRK